jgi:hypothetical protein
MQTEELSVMGMEPTRVTGTPHPAAVEAAA